MKCFYSNVKDITSVLELTVFDEDRHHRVKFLGGVMIPLLRIRNGEKRWYTLKDKLLCARANGNSPRVFRIHISKMTYTKSSLCLTIKKIDFIRNDHNMESISGCSPHVTTKRRETGTARSQIQTIIIYA